MGKELYFLRLLRSLNEIMSGRHSHHMRSHVSAGSAGIMSSVSIISTSLMYYFISCLPHGGDIVLIFLG